VHTFFLLLSLLLAAVISVSGASFLRLLPVGGRRSAALSVLGLPPAVVLLGVSHLVPRFWQDCAPLVGWDRVASFGLLGLLGAMGFGALGLNLTRLALVDRLLPACSALCDPVVRADTEALAARLGVRTPCVRILRSAEPLAAAGGLWQPNIVLSTWLIDHLDRDELQSVLTHELAHLVRRDYLLRWIARLLRDATAYLPGSWYALQVLEDDEELAADALAVGATRQPLAMASALGKVWRAVTAPHDAGFAGLPAYAATSAELLEQRLSRLLNGDLRPSSALPGHALASISIVSVGALAPRLLALSAAALPLMCTLRN
jgi:Zn-dependent protease with chaperone function